jgi:excisionase family DNA binding protein
MSIPHHGNWKSGQQSKAQFFTIAAVAQRLDVSARTVHRWIGEGKLIVHRFGRSVRISEADLNAFLAAHRAED